MAREFEGQSRRRTRELDVGGVGIGGDNPVRIQSMIISPTLNTEACIQEIEQLVAAGCEIVRIITPSVLEARNLQAIKEGLLARGCNIPIVADIESGPEEAMVAAEWADKIRINPGNYANSLSAQEQFAPLVMRCMERGIGIRLGVNQGSLSRRILERYGNSQHGMVESGLEFARVARELGFHSIIFSMKASDPRLTILANRLLVSRLREEGPDWNYPIHIGVTEAGQGTDARIKSAIGIGSLLQEGIGDTVRVALAEDSVNEISVAQAIIDECGRNVYKEGEDEGSLGPLQYKRRPSAIMTINGTRVGGEAPTRVAAQRQVNTARGGRQEVSELPAEFALDSIETVKVDPDDLEAMANINQKIEPQLVTLRSDINLPVVEAYRLLSTRLNYPHLILLEGTLFPTIDLRQRPESPLRDLVRVAMLGGLACDGIGDALLINSKGNPNRAVQLAYGILQAAGSRSVRPNYVICPSCGHTKFDVPVTAMKVENATRHLKDVKIAVIGCSINGRGEMANADFGYVGNAAGTVTLYVGETPVERSIPEAIAVERLIALIKAHGRWVEQPQQAHAVA